MSPTTNTFVLILTLLSIMGLAFILPSACPRVTSYKNTKIFTNYGLIII